MKSKEIFTPGPTRVPHRVLGRMAQPLIHHRTEDFREIHREVVAGLQYMMHTKNPVVVLSSSGSGAMEAALVNLTQAGEKVLVTELGKFSSRWRELGEAYGLDVVSVEAEWGTPVSPDQVKAALAANPDIGLVFTTHTETSTGVLQDVKSISRLAHEHGALVVVDAITSLCAQVVETDNWNLDVVIGGSQKGFMVPPGLAFLSISDAAMERMERQRHPVYYFDLAKALKALDTADTPWTPAITLFIGLHEALAMLEEEGRENVIRRHTRNAKGVRAAVKAIGLKRFASIPCNATTAVLPKDGTANAIRKRMADEYGVLIAGGQAHLKGRILRLGHLGFYDAGDMFKMITSLEATLLDLKLLKTVGRGVEALINEFREN
jgi:aspartate aminotransferase-like enzyme